MTSKIDSIINTEQRLMHLFAKYGWEIEVCITNTGNIKVYFLFAENEDFWIGKWAYRRNSDVLDYLEWFNHDYPTELIFKKLRTISWSVNFTIWVSHYDHRVRIYMKFPRKMNQVTRKKIAIFIWEGKFIFWEDLHSVCIDFILKNTEISFYDIKLYYFKEDFRLQFPHLEPLPDRGILQVVSTNNRNKYMFLPRGCSLKTVFPYINKGCRKYLLAYIWEDTYENYRCTFITLEPEADLNNEQVYFTYKSHFHDS